MLSGLQEAPLLWHFSSMQGETLCSVGFASVRCISGLERRSTIWKGCSLRKCCLANSSCDGWYFTPHVLNAYTGIRHYATNTPESRGHCYSCPLSIAHRKFDITFSLCHVAVVSDTQPYTNFAKKEVSALQTQLVPKSWVHKKAILDTCVHDSLLCPMDSGDGASIF